MQSKGQIHRNRQVILGSWVIYSYIGEDLLGESTPLEGVNIAD
jgi:hypothetical protein